MLEKVEVCVMVVCGCASSSFLRTYNNVVGATPFLIQRCERTQPQLLQQDTREQTDERCIEKVGVLVATTKLSTRSMQEELHAQFQQKRCSETNVDDLPCVKSDLYVAINKQAARWADVSGEEIGWATVGGTRWRVHFFTMTKQIKISGYH